MICQCSVSGIISYIVFSFPRLAISAAHFLVVFHHFQICKICHSSTYYKEKKTSIKENIITKLQKLYSPPRNLRAGNKSPTLFLKKSYCTGNLLPKCKIFIEGSVTCFIYALVV